MIPCGSGSAAFGEIAFFFDSTRGKQTLKQARFFGNTLEETSGDKRRLAPN
jgi:hypothetical protein